MTATAKIFRKTMIEELQPGLAPEELFARVQDRAHAFFLDSALPANGLGAFSFLGFDPFLLFRAKGDAITITTEGRKQNLRGDPFAKLRELIGRYAGAPAAGLPFSGGAVGYISYEAGLRFERIAPVAEDDLPGVADLEFGFYDAVLAFDRSSQRAWIVATPVPGRDVGDSVRRLRSIVLAAQAQPAPVLARPAAAKASEPRSNFAKPDYLRAIQRIRDYIASGDVYQVNLTQRFEAPLAWHPFALYQRLRARSPAPYSSYLNFGAVQVVSSSPERFLSVREGMVTTRPIKGTRRRAENAGEDAQRAADLIASEKDRAELLMIVDLERNDLGRVCEFGSIRVDELYRLETHPTVHHLVANVSGKLQAGHDVFDCLRAAFPGGSITGAPKVRVMQIIRELETRRRYIYTGSIGYLGFDGTAELNIAIRTITCTGGRAYYHVGGGIVWDSDPESEYQETLDKGFAMRAALVDPE